MNQEALKRNTWMSLLVPQSGTKPARIPRRSPFPAPAQEEASVVEAAPAPADLELGKHDRELTEGELDVLRRMTEGATNAQIARARGCAVATVKVHVARIFRKLGVVNRTQAVLAAERLPALRTLRGGVQAASVFRPEWVTRHATLEAHPAGRQLFALGNAADALYYLHSGEVRFPEIDAKLGAGQLFGEIGVFSPLRRRTSSAVCETPVRLFVLDGERARDLCMQNPLFALHVTQLVAARMSAARGVDRAGE